MFAEPYIDTNSLSTTPVQPIKSEFALSFSMLFNGEYIMSHHVIKNGLLQSGKPIDPIAAMSAVMSVCEKESVSGWTNPQVAYETNTMLVWQRKASAKPESLWFRATGASAVVEISAKLPSLVFILNKRTNNISIFAKTGNALPTGKTILYHAPLCNINGHGALCVGTATMPAMSDSNNKIIEMCEAAITDTLFTHPNHGKTFQAKEAVTMNDHVAYWKRLSETGKAPSLTDMVKTNLTLQKVIASLEKN